VPCSTTDHKQAQAGDRGRSRVLLGLRMLLRDPDYLPLRGGYGYTHSLWGLQGAPAVHAVAVCVSVFDQWLSTSTDQTQAGALGSTDRWWV